MHNLTVREKKNICRRKLPSSPTLPPLKDYKLASLQSYGPKHKQSKTNVQCIAHFICRDTFHFIALCFHMQRLRVHVLFKRQS